jgi:hypothetical protein
MRKAKTLLLVAAVLAAVAGAGIAGAADKAGVGMTWGIGPMIPLGNFEMKFDDTFTLYWKVSNDFQVGVFRETSSVRGEESQTVSGTDPVLKETLVAQADAAASGIRLLHSVPGLDFVTAGLDIGVITFTGGTTTLSRSDGSAAVGTFGNPVVLAGTAPLLGVTSKLSIFSAETKTVTTDISVTGSLRFVTFNDLAVFGTQKDLEAPTSAIDPINSFHNLTLLLGVGIGF